MNLIVSEFGGAVEFCRPLVANNHNVYALELKLENLITMHIVKHHVTSTTTKVKQTVSSVKTGAKGNASNSLSPDRHQVRQACTIVHVPRERIVAKMNSSEEERKYPESAEFSKLSHEAIQLWMLDFPLSATQQNLVNHSSFSQLQAASALDSITDRNRNVRIPKINPGGRRASPSITVETPRPKFKVKQPKFETANLKRVVKSVTANLMGINRSGEPEPKVGTKLPTQFQPVAGSSPLLPPRPSKEQLDLLLRGVPIPPPIDPNLDYSPIRQTGWASFDERIRRARNNLQLVYKWESLVPFGPEPYDGPDVWIDYDISGEKPVPIPGDQIIFNRDNRLLRVRFINFTFPYLNFLGKWNDSVLNTNDTVFNKQWGIHFHEENVSVDLPSSLVNELISWWAHKRRDEGNCLLAVAKCKTLVAELAITSEQQMVANLYAPAVAMYKSWDEQQNVTRVMYGEYIHAGKTISKNLKAIKTKKGKFFLAGALISTVIVLVSVAKVCFFFSEHAKGGLKILRNAKDNLKDLTRYGVEPNPGPGLEIEARSKALINCVHLPQSKRMKPKSSLRLREEKCRANILTKSDLDTRGCIAEYGFNTKSYQPNAFAGNRHNEKEAFFARVLSDTIEPDETLFDCISWAKKNHRGLFPNMYNVQSVSSAEYLRRSNASPGVKRVLLATFKKLEEEGIDEDSVLNARQLYLFTKRSAFVKVENDLYSSEYGRKNKAPRLIQGATPEFICLVGPWIMALQDLFKRRWNIKNFVCFTSGVSAEKAASFILSGEGQWLEDDLGKFDCSIRKPWCDYEVWLADQFGAPRAVLDLMHANIMTHGISAHGWSYKCEGTRKSGDPYTSLMNSIINGVAHIFLYCDFSKRDLSSARHTLKMLVQGDDNLMRHREGQHYNWQKGMAGLGFDSEAIYRQNSNQVEFCSSRLYTTNEGAVFGPKPGKVLAKFGYIINPPKGVTRASMMRGVALGLDKNCSFIAPLKTVIDRVLELTKGIKAYVPRKLQFTPFEEDALLPTQRHTASVETMLNLDFNYFWDYSTQSRFQKCVSEMNFGDSYDSCSELLFDRDTSGIQGIFGSGWSVQRPEVCGS